MDSSHAYFAEKLHHNLKGGLGTSDDAVVRVVVSHSEVSGPVRICLDTCFLDCNAMRLVFMFHNHLNY